MPPLDMNVLIGNVDIVFLTLDTLRYDVALQTHEAGRTPVLSSHLGGWERRHSPGSFTYASHTAFFAGFLPTPAYPGLHPRLMALDFQGSATTTERTKVLQGASIVGGLAAIGYHTICIGGTGFFSKKTPLGCVLPNLFQESFWDPSLGVTDPNSTEHQVALAKQRLDAAPHDACAFVFINISALHQPNHFYLEDCDEDSVESHAAALEYVDAALAPLFDDLRRDTLFVVCSDHGTAYGEEGYEGHRVGLPVVWDVPYAHALCGAGRK